MPFAVRQWAYPAWGELHQLLNKKEGEDRGMISTLLTRRFWIAVVALAVAGWAPALARDWYFSSCATGGTGTLQDPYCLDPASSGKNVSFSYLADGTGSELAAGDTVYLCAGACDGAGSATYGLETTGTGGLCGSWFFEPRVSGTSASPITIRNYPGETVTLRGDKNGNGVMDPGEVSHMVTNTNGRAWYRIVGLKFYRSGADMFCGRGAGFPNWTFDALNVSESDSRTWGVTAGIGTIGAVNTCGSGSQGAYCFYITGNTGSVTISNSVIHTCCHSAVRFVASPNSTSLTVNNNEFYDATTSVEFWNTSHVTISNNNIHDVHLGIQVEDRTSFAVIEGNTISCLGQYAPDRDGRCLQAIAVDSGDNDDPADTFNGKYNQTHDITIRQNRIYATNVASPLAHSGKFNGGITYTASCLDNKGCTAINGLIENNMIWNQKTLWSGHALTRGALDISTNKPITVQNNTIYDTSYPMQIDGSVSGVEHVIRNNLISKCAGECIAVFPRGNGNGIAYNNLHNSSGVVLGFCTSTDCSSYTSSYTMATLASGFGRNNRSLPPGLMNTSGAVGTWDLHLSSLDTANKNTGTSGPAVDIDREARVAPVDIGADEYQGAPPGPPSATLSIASAPVRPSDGVFLLKAGSWSVTLIANRSVVNVPTPLTFRDSSGATVAVTLSGTVPGTTFTGTMVVGTGMPDGAGTFSLATGALVDTSGGSGNSITQGSQAVVDKTPPSVPANLIFQ